MASQSTPAPTLDVLLTLRLTLALWWREFVPITLLGFAFITLPALFARLVVPADPGPGIATIVFTAQAVLGMVFVASISFSGIAALIGRRFDPRRFMLLGLGASQPGLVTALTLGAGLVTVGIVIVLSRSLGQAGSLLAFAALAIALWSAATLLPAIPAAVVEELTPVRALERAAGLTHGNRWRLAALVLFVGTALMVIVGGLTVLLFGENADPKTMRRIADAMTLTNPGLWIALLSDVLIFGVLACLPPAVYTSLALKKR